MENFKNILLFTILFLQNSSFIVSKAYLSIYANYLMIYFAIAILYLRVKNVPFVPSVAVTSKLNENTTEKVHFLNNNLNCIEIRF